MHFSVCMITLRDNTFQNYNAQEKLNKIKHINMNSPKIQRNFSVDTSNFSNPCLSSDLDLVSSVGRNARTTEKTVTPDIQTPNSKLKTPNSKLQTPNRKSQTENLKANRLK